VPNLYGVAQPVPMPILVGTVGGGVDVACPAGTETTVFTFPTYAALDHGAYYPVVTLNGCVTLGATIPTQLVFAFKLGAGSDVTASGVPANLFTANGNLFFSTVMFGINSLVSWVAPGSVVNVTLNPTGQAVTMRGSGAQCMLQLFRGPDL
jgi:hypothetical protein